MSQKENLEKVIGIVIEALPNALFKVEFDDKNGEKVLTLAYLAGKMRLNRIRVLVGDKVEMELEPYGGKARIIRRN